MRQLTISKQVTNRESQSLDKYLQEIGKLELINSDTEVELAVHDQRRRSCRPSKTDKSQSAICGFSRETISKSRAVT